MTKYLITGGAGFIGSHFVEYLIAKLTERGDAYSITCVDALYIGGSLGNMATFINHPQVDFIQLDITQESDVKEVFSKVKPDIVIHFAAETHVDRSIQNPGLFVRTNIEGTQYLLNESITYKVKLFHYVSTDEVYGSHAGKRVENSLFTESSPVLPTNPYAATKAAAELLVLAANRTFQLPITISRSSNNYGTRQATEKLIPCVLARLDKGLEIDVYGEGLEQRDWLHVKDHCCAIYTILTRGTVGEIYNIASGREISNIALLNLIMSIKGIEPPFLYNFVKNRPAHDFSYAMKIDKICALGWRPEITLEEGLQQLIKEYK